MIVTEIGQKICVSHVLSSAGTEETLDAPLFLVLHFRFSPRIFLLLAITSSQQEHSAMPVAISFSTIPEMFWGLTDKFLSLQRPVLLHKSGGIYIGITYKELREKVELFAFGLASLGINKGDRVSIVSENRPEWVIADQAIAALGGIVVPVYPTMTARQNAFIFNNADVRIVITSNQFQLTKVLRVIEEVPSLERIILMNGQQQTGDSRVISFQSVMSLGKEFRKTNPNFLEASRTSVRPDDLLTLIYTSGTTGNPKGVMLTHSNLCTNITASASVIPFGPEDTLLSFLPLSHSFERMAGYYTAMSCGATVAFAESVETVRENMLEIRPTVMTTVPRLFERIHARILKQVEAESALRRRIFFWALEVGRARAKAIRGGKVSVFLKLNHVVADLLVFRKIKQRTGGRMRFFVSGGAALGREFGEFFEAVGLTVIEGYGLTESSPVIAVNRLDNYHFGSVGQTIPGVEVRIAEDGEILARGPNIMRGYWRNSVASAEAIDADGWLYTGDVGYLDENGFLHITDRKKHLFVSSGGKNIAPQPIENLFLSSRYIDQFMLVGDRRMFLTALIVPDFDALREFAAERGITFATNSELAAHPVVNQFIESHIGTIQKDLAGFERVRRFTILDQEFSIENGELTPTQKVRRKIIEEKYAHLIEKMYQDVTRVPA
jgi:long-chain acyl-CoA synthetase